MADVHTVTDTLKQVNFVNLRHKIAPGRHRWSIIARKPYPAIRYKIQSRFRSSMILERLLSRRNVMVTSQLRLPQEHHRSQKHSKMSRESMTRRSLQPLGEHRHITSKYHHTLQVSLLHTSRKSMSSERRVTWNPVL
jgi:hypothetical protein